VIMVNRRQHARKGRPSPKRTSSSVQSGGLEQLPHRVGAFIIMAGLRSCKKGNASVLQQRHLVCAHPVTAIQTVCADETSAFRRPRSLSPGGRRAEVLVHVEGSTPSCPGGTDVPRIWRGKRVAVLTAGRFV
jgi:hypothetical protein